MRNNSKVIETSFDNTVKKSNDLVMSKLSHGLSISQMQLLAYAIYTTQQDNKSTFALMDFENKFNRERYQTKSIHADLNKLISIKFTEKNFKGDTDGVFVWNAFSGMSYAKGEFHFEWSERMRSHIIELKEKYIVTDLAVAGLFQSGYSWILYEYLKAHYGYWHRTIERDELLNLFGIQNTKAYKHLGSLRNKVLEVAIEEINKYTELDVKYEDIKEGRVVAGFRFNWSVGSSENMITQSQQENIILLVNSVLDDALKYLDVRNQNRLIEIRNITQEFKDLSIFIRGEGIRELTTEKAKNLIDAVTQKVNKVEAMYKMDLEEQRQPAPTEQTKKVPFYNWLEERE